MDTGAVAAQEIRLKDLVPFILDFKGEASSSINPNIGYKDPIYFEV